MTYLFGTLLSLLCGLGNSVTKGVATSLKTKHCLLLSSWFNLSSSIILYLIFFRNQGISLTKLTTSGIMPIVILLMYLSFRIFSNTAQTKLFSKKHININVLNIMLSCIFFVTMGIDVIMGASYGLITVVGFILSLIGICVITVDFKNLKFYFTKEEVILLLVAYICAGTKPVMAKYILNYVPFSVLAVLELINYVIIYTLYNLKEIRSIKVSKQTLFQLIIQSLICASCAFIQYKVVIDVKAYILTSFTTPVFTAIFAYLIHKEVAKRKTLIGIAIILIGICIAKLNI